MRQQEPVATVEKIKDVKKETLKTFAKESGPKSSSRCCLNKIEVPQGVKDKFGNME